MAIALANEAINMVERRAFVRLLKTALLRYKIPSRPYFSEKIIPDIYNKIVAKIKKCFLMRTLYLLHQIYRLA